MLASDSCCPTCSPKMRGKTITETVVAYDECVQLKMEAREKHRQSMEDYYARRFNRVPKR